MMAANERPERDLVATAEHPRQQLQVVLDGTVMSLDEARAAKVVAETQNPSDDEDDPYSTLVQAGKYDVAFRRCERAKLFGREVWFIEFQIATPGFAYDRPILAFASALKPNARVARSSTLATMFIAATGKRPPRDLYRRSPASFLAGRIFEAVVATVKKDRFGVEVPHGARYSRVRALVRVVAGSMSESAG